MRFFSLYRVELRRLLLTRFIWLISALSLCSPLLGYTVYKPVTAGAMSGLYIGNPVLAGTAAGAVLWAVIAIVEGNRQRRSGTDILAEAIAPPVAHSAAKAAALVTISSIVTALCSLVYLPYTAIKLDYLFNAGYYFAHFLVLMLPTWWISILFAESIYRITRRVELSALIYAALAYMSFSRFTRNKYLLQWLNPILGSYSDGFPDIWFLRMGAYSRLMWLCAAAGLWAFSLMCQRRYQKGLFGSFVKSLKKVYLPISAAFLIASGTVLWNVQPFIGHGGEEFDVSAEDEFFEIGSAPCLTDIKYSIELEPVLGTLSGRAEYRLTTPKSGKSVFRLNAGYKVKSITYGGEAVDFLTVKEDLNGQYDTYFELPEKVWETLVIEYGGFPTVAQCMMPSVDVSIGENYISMSRTDIAPFLADYTYLYGDSVIALTLPENLVPFIEFEPMTEFVENGNGTRTYKANLGTDCIYDLTAGNYVVDTFSSENGMDFIFVYGDYYSSVVYEYDVRQSICEVYDYCIEHYGKSPLIGRKPFTLFLQSSLFQGGFAIHGVSVWCEDVMSPNTLSDPNKGANATEIFIHEMIHQWWGGLGALCEDDGLWSEEGLTVYSTYRLIKEKYGELYAKQYYVDAWKQSVDAQNRNFYNRHPEYLDRLPESYQEQIRVSNSSINMYQRMPLMILKAEELVGGEEEMDKILSRLYSDYCLRNGQQGISYKTFLDYCGLTEEDLELD